ncbi:programmed cell death 1 ligand 2-like isoform X1 [Varanus komodoensis]|uniref:Programmed cell death 1 ligand 2 n=1 Tax=Varanus komodoensis TaxID=61221 RepID=A0A8D2L6E6_VARKO|nr:programmed cell death 1 ligand 2-like isoform X1 [Varanus komodoensis]
MFRFFPALLLESQIYLLAALFTVEVLQPHYRAEFGSEAIMGCRFPVTEPLNLTRLSILWQTRELPGDLSREVYRFTKGQEDLTRQHSDFRRRATVKQKELRIGRSVLHLNNVKLTDAGTYICLVEYEGADYKFVLLEVEAPYKRIQFQERREEGDVILTCQAEGYPLAEVFWYNEDTNFSTSANTTFAMTNDGLFSVTSFLRFKGNIHGNYSCVFWNKKLNEETSVYKILPGTSITRRIPPISFVLPVCLLALTPLIAFMWKVLRRKPFTNCTPRGKRRKSHHLSKSRQLRSSDAVTAT